MTNYDISSTEQESLPPIDQIELPITGQEAVVKRHTNDMLEAIEYAFAEFHYKNGLRVVFSYDEISKDYGLLQEGRLGESTPIVLCELDSLLKVYLSITPKNLPIPEELLGEGGKRKDFGVEIKDRPISTTYIVAKQLDLPISSQVVPMADQSCLSTYYSWWDWHEPAFPGMSPQTYYASTFGGKKRYTQSYVCNCAPAATSGSWLWARHRIYYKDAFGNYKKQFEGKVAPGHWQAKTKGSIKRWRAVSYDDGWDSHPGGNVNLKYTREGRFTN